MPSDPVDSSFITLSPLDEERFGIRSARATVTQISQIQNMFAFCEQNRVVFLTTRCPVDSLEIVHPLEKNHFNLMDTLIYYQLNLMQEKSFYSASVRDGVTIRSIMPDDLADVLGVTRIAQEAFQNYHGHYHADPRLDRAKCDAVYVSWATRSCTILQVADSVLIAERNGQMIGFSTVKRNSDEEGECPLFAVASNARGTGVYHALVARAIEWHRERGMQRVISSTQITNFASQRTWSRNGWVPDHAFYTFHRWFDPLDMTTYAL